MNDEYNAVFDAIDSQLETQISGLYKSANETFITSLISSLLYLVIFTFISIIPLPENIRNFNDFKRILGFGGGGSASSISLVSGIKQRLDKRNKARELQAGKKLFQKLGQSESLFKKKMGEDYLERYIEILGDILQK